MKLGKIKRKMRLKGNELMKREKRKKKKKKN
jgi:hypothetical protein